MRKLLTLPSLILTIMIVMGSCGDNSTWEEYETWRQDNNKWYVAQMNRTNPNGSPYYTPVQPDWYPESGVLIRYFNDRNLTAGNLQPMITSQVKVKYVGRLYDDSCFDSTTTGSDSTRTLLLSSTITGWQLALTQMHVGDSCEVIIPYTLGYGYQGSSDGYGNYSIPPYSALRFNIKLVDIPAYEIQ